MNIFPNFSVQAHHNKNQKHRYSISDFSCGCLPKYPVLWRKKLNRKMSECKLYLDYSCTKWEFYSIFFIVWWNIQIKIIDKFRHSCGDYLLATGPVGSLLGFIWFALLLRTILLFGLSSFALLSLVAFCSCVSRCFGCFSMMTSDLKRG